jgi:hypothetical protein
MVETTLRQALDGARAVEFADGIPVFVAWHGGTTYNVYSAHGDAIREVDVFTRDDGKGRPVDPETARAAMREHLDHMTDRLRSSGATRVYDE